jgi:hypothetical protein
VDIYGTDMSVFYQGTLGIDPTDATISGARVVLENCAKRLCTPRGFLKKAPNFGYDLLTRVGARVSAVGLARVENEIRAELLKEQGVLAVPTVKITTAGRSAWTVNIGITLASGPFLLVLAVTDVSLSILQAGKA